MQQAGRLYLSTWIRKADEVYRASRDLTLVPIYSGAVPMFLLHWSIELYLKGFLLESNAFVTGHSLKRLYNRCKSIDPNLEKIEVLDLRGDGKCYPSFWINYIDVFGEEKGGVRYLNKSKTMYAYPTNIHNNFDDLIAYIKNVIDGDTDITDFC